MSRPIQYQRYENDENIGVEEADIHSISSGDSGEEDQSRQPPMTYRQRYQYMLRDRWPRGIGLWQIFMGFCTTLLGITQVFVVPTLEKFDGDALSIITFTKHNVYGVGIWVGILMVIAGSTGVRAFLYKSISTVYLFFSLTLFNLMVLTFVVIVTLIGYSEHWTTRDAYPKGSALFYVHIGVVLSLGTDLVLTVMAFTQYYEDVFCGEMQLCRRCIHCCLPCCCPPAVSQEDLLVDGPERPPSLPV